MGADRRRAGRRGVERAETGASERAAWLRGGLALAADAFAGTVGLVQGVHRSITCSIGRINPAAYPVSRVSDFVYGRVRDIGGLSFAGAGQLAGLAETLVPARKGEIPARLSLGLHSALNGAFGDHLEASGNELALSMDFVAADGRPIALTRHGVSAGLDTPTPRLVVLIHGLGMNDRQWRRGARDDFGERLARDYGYTALRLRYNSGRHISENGRELACRLQALVDAYPVALARVTLIGHSMGGLVARSAAHYAHEAGLDWPRLLSDMVLLGSPHLGAPLERLGNRVTHLLTRVAYTQPFARLGDVRSAGVKDLRYGDLRDEDRGQGDRSGGEYTASPALRSRDHVGHFLVAATLGRCEDDPLGRWFGDLLVPVGSAFGHARTPSRRFAARDQDGRVFYGMNHFALLHHDDVYRAIAVWLGPRLDFDSAGARSIHSRGEAISDLER